jgi:hypothetical protein
LYLENKDLENPRSNRDLLELLLNDILWIVIKRFSLNAIT